VQLFGFPTRLEGRANWRHFPSVAISGAMHGASQKSQFFVTSTLHGKTAAGGMQPRRGHQSDGVLDIVAGVAPGVVGV
jgi:hypothetical protein